MKKLAFLLSILTILISACGGDDDNHLSISENNLSFSGSGGARTIDVASNVEWSAMSDQTWCVISPKLGYGNATISITAQRNTTTVERSAKITIKAIEGGLSKEIAITQAAGQPEGPVTDPDGHSLDANPEQLDFEVNGGNKTLQVAANVEWTIISDQSWCTISPSSGSGNVPVTVTVTSNTGTARRIAILNIRNSEHSLDKEVTVMQLGVEPSIILSSGMKEVGAGAITFDVEVTTNVEFDVIPEVSWITKMQTNGHLVTLQVQANPETTNRSGAVIFKQKDGDASATLTVTQAGRPVALDIAMLPGVWQAVSLVNEQGATMPYTNISGILFTLKEDKTYAWELTSSDLSVVRGVITGVWTASAEARTITCNGTMYFESGAFPSFKDDCTYSVVDLTTGTMVIAQETSQGTVTYTFRKKDVIRTARISTLAGDVTFSSPSGVVVDAGGNLYVSEWSGHRIRKISPAGAVSVFVGSGVAGFADGTGTAAKFNNPNNLAIDASNNIYVSDCSNYRVRAITPAGAVVSILTGSSSNLFRGVAVNAAGSILYTADSNNRRILKATAGVLSTLAGSGVTGLLDGMGTAARFGGPMGIAVDAAGVVYVADQTNNAIRKITPAGKVTTLAGNGVAGYVDGAGTVARLNKPNDVAVDAEGNLYIVELNNHCVRKITPAGLVTTIAGSKTPGYADGAGASALFNTPSGLTIDVSNNTIYVIDLTNNRIRKITLE